MAKLLQVQPAEVKLVGKVALFEIVDDWVSYRYSRVGEHIELSKELCISTYPGQALREKWPRYQPH